MILGLVTAATGCMIAHFLKSKTWWLKRHHLLEYVGYGTMLISLTLGFTMVALVSVLHFRVLHPYFGITVIVLYALSTISGLGIFKRIEQARKLRKIHTWISRIATTIMVITVILAFLTPGLI